MPQQIDAAMRVFGMPMGNVLKWPTWRGSISVGQPAKRLAPSRDPNERYVKIADRLCELGRFGTKNR